MFFHCATAVLAVVQSVRAQTIDLFSKEPLRVDARSMHISLGLLVTTLLAARVTWRATRGRRPPLTDAGALSVLVKATHWDLYTLLAAMVLVATVLAWTRGDSFFSLFSIPAYDSGNRGLPGQIQQVHATLGSLILWLGGLHASAALVHRYLWQDGVLSGMLPSRGCAGQRYDPNCCR